MRLVAAISPFIMFYHRSESCARGSAVTKRTFEKSVGGGVVTRYLIAAKEILMATRDYGVYATRFLAAGLRCVRYPPHFRLPKASRLVSQSVSQSVSSASLSFWPLVASCSLKYHYFGGTFMSGHGPRHAFLPRPRPSLEQAHPSFFVALAQF